MDNPLFGVGYGRGRLKDPLRAHLKGSEFAHGPILHTHNVYVELFAGTGLVGLFAFLWMIGQTLLRLWRSSLGRFGTERVLGVGLAAAWIAAIVAGLGDILFYHHETRIFFFTLLGTAHIYYSSSETNEAFSNSRVGAL
jgi:O-antigen ligase